MEAITVTDPARAPNACRPPETYVPSRGVTAATEPNRPSGDQNRRYHYPDPKQQANCWWWVVDGFAMGSLNESRVRRKPVRVSPGAEWRVNEAEPHQLATRSFRARGGGRGSRLRVGLLRHAKYRNLYTCPVAKIVPFTEARSKLSELLDEVAQRQEHVVVTRNGRPAAVVLSSAEYDALTETLEVLEDAETLEALRESEADYREGRTQSLTEVRRELGLA